MNKPDPQTMIERAHVAIMRNVHWCWLTNVVLLGKWEVLADKSVTVNVRGQDRKIEFSPVTTAATDGFNVMYYQPFLDKAWDAGGDKAIRSIVLHENLHKAFRHMSVWKALFQRDGQRTNIATDIVIGNELSETPEFCFDHGQLGDLLKMKFAHAPQWKDKNTGEVFDLLDDKTMKKMFGEGGAEGAAGDIHMPGGGEPGDKPGEEGEGQAAGEELSEAEQDAIMDAAVRQGIIVQRGRDPGRADRNAQAMAPKVDWKAALRNWLQGRSFGYDLNDWRKRSRRSRSLGVYLPSHYSTRVGRVVAAIDTSGSIGNVELGQFLGELNALCKALSPVSLELLYWDASVAKHESYNPATYSTMLQTTRPAGGGGTDVGCVFKYIDKNIDDVRGVIVLTDGYTPFPPKYKTDTLWISNGIQASQFPWGAAVNI